MMIRVRPALSRKEGRNRVHQVMESPTSRTSQEEDLEVGNMVQRERSR